MSAKVKRQIHANSTCGTMKTFEFITGSPNPTAARPFWSCSNGPNPSTPLRFTLRKASRPSRTAQRHDMCWSNVFWCSSAHEKNQKKMMHAACDSFWKWYIDIENWSPPTTYPDVFAMRLCIGRLERGGIGLQPKLVVSYPLTFGT